MERILRCVIRYQDEQKEARLAMVDSMGALALILASTMRFIYQNPNGNHANSDRAQAKLTMDRYG